ncbi:MAG: hypothetical protein Q7T57_05540 [Dehalococcoidales bacterium]|nr:hypothetical protein [Dehalococcoidales bacterium]
MFNIAKVYDPKGDVRNIQQSKGWQEHITNDVPFATGNGGRNIVLQGHMDGFQAFRHKVHTMTPITCQILNLPENLRHRAEFIILVGLIPGPREPTNYNAYTSVWVKELQDLYTDGMEMDDPLNKGTKMTIRVKLLNLCADLPAFQHLLYQQGSSAHDGCFKCYIKVSCDFVIMRYDFVIMRYLTLHCDMACFRASKHRIAPVSAIIRS